MGLSSQRKTLLGDILEHRLSCYQHELKQNKLQHNQTTYTPLPVPQLQHFSSAADRQHLSVGLQARTVSPLPCVRIRSLTLGFSGKHPANPPHTVSRRGLQRIRVHRVLRNRDPSLHVTLKMKISKTRFSFSGVGGETNRHRTTFTDHSRSTA